MMILVTYDVSTIDRNGQGRLRRAAKICQNYGQRVQNSVFECLVDQVQYLVLKSKLVEIIDQTSDSLRFYRLGSSWKQKVEHVGTKKIQPITDSIVL